MDQITREVVLTDGKSLRFHLITMKQESRWEELDEKVV